MDKYIEDAHSDLQNWANNLVDELESFAQKKDLEPNWVLETFLYKFTYQCKNKIE